MSTAEAAGSAVAAKPARKKAHRSDRSNAERKLGLMLCAPAAIVMVAVTGYPILYAIWLSLHRSDLRFPDNTAWIGLDNYVTVLSANLWWKDLFHTVVLTALSVSIELVLGMLLALAMHRAIFGRGLIRTTALVPYGIVTVVAAFAWRLAFSKADGGFVPAVLHLQSDPLITTWSTYLTAILAEAWKTTPFMALLLLAGLALVPDDLHEAAKVDGASAWQRFTHLTLPLLRPYIAVAVTIELVNAMQVFTSVYVLTRGGPGDHTETAGYFVWSKAFQHFQLGYASAAGIVIWVILVVLAVVNYRITNRGEAQPW